MNDPKTYRERPKMVEAVLWDGDPRTAENFIGAYGAGWEHVDESNTAIYLDTPDGVQIVPIGHYIIKNPIGTFDAGHGKLFPLLYKEVA